MEVTMGRIDRFLGTYEIEPQNRWIGKGCHRTASKPVSHPFHDHADRDHDLIFHHFPHDSMPSNENRDDPRRYENRDANGNQSS